MEEIMKLSDFTKEYLTVAIADEEVASEIAKCIEEKLPLSEKAKEYFTIMISDATVAAEIISAIPVAGSQLSEEAMLYLVRGLSNDEAAKEIQASVAS